jgi:hypothetical protein
VQFDIRFVSAVSEYELCKNARNAFGRCMYSCGALFCTHFIYDMSFLYEKLSISQNEKVHSVDEATGTVT